jgi:hypothetical protein
MKRVWFFLVVYIWGLTFLIAGCATSEEKRWEQAQRMNTIQSYEDFLKWCRIDSGCSYYKSKFVESLIIDFKKQFLNNLKQITILPVEMPTSGMMNYKERASVQHELSNMLKEELEKADYSVVSNGEQAALKVIYKETEVFSIAGDIYEATPNDVQIDLDLFNQEYGELSSLKLSTPIPKGLASHQRVFNYIEKEIREQFRENLPFKLGSF